MRAWHFLCFGGGRIWGKGLMPVKCICPPPPHPPCGFGCCLFWGGSSVDFDSLLIVAPRFFYVLLCVVLCQFFLCYHLDKKKRVGCFALFVFWCLVIVVWLFLMMPQVCLQFVIVVFPDHTHLLFSQRIIHWP